MKLSFCLAMAMLGCASSSPSPDERAPTCDPERLTRDGHLPACAAGTSGPDGPGVPADTVRRAPANLALSADEAAAVARANAQSAARAGAAIDRGFAESAR